MFETFADRRVRIAVIGAGNIGCHVGGRLAEAADVTLIGRERIIGDIARRGLTLTGGGRATTTVPADHLRLATDPNAVAGADVVLVTTKSTGTRQAAAQIASQLTPETVVVSIQNGLHNPAVIREALTTGFPDRASRPVVVGGMIGYNVVETGPATFHQATGGELVLQDHPAVAPLVVAAAEGGLTVRVTEDIREVQHAKLLMNLNNALNALSGLPLRDELSTRAFRRCLALCQDEALAAFDAEGVRPARLTPVPAHMTPQVLRAPDPVFRVLAARTLKIDPGARSSMADDLAAGRPTEIDELQGAVVALGARHEVPTPVNARVVDLVHAAEAAGPRARRWPAGDLLADLEAHARPSPPGTSARGGRGSMSG